jgi:hypothetical protein
MSVPTTQPAAEALPPTAQIEVREEQPAPDLRRAAEQAVSAIAERSADTRGRERTADAAVADLIETLNAPLVRLGDTDRPAVEGALDALRGHHVIGVDDLVGPDLEVLVPGPPVSVVAAQGLEVRGVPFDFGWSWFDGGGGPPFSQMLNRETGRIGIDARSGAVEGGVSGFVNAHAGFGVALTTDHTVRAVGRCARRTHYSYHVRAVGVGSNMTAEGGTELTVLEDGALIAAATEKVFRKRVSASLFSPDESDDSDSGGFGVGEAMQVNFTMQPGRIYTFNIGGWAFCDRATGVGAAGGQALVEVDAIALTIQRDG